MLERPHLSFEAERIGVLLAQTDRALTRGTEPGASGPIRGAPPYRDREHDILTVDTASLLEASPAVVELAHMNPGAVHPGANYPRGAGTFRRHVCLAGSPRRLGA
jgi:hypothetical protein